VFLADSQSRKPAWIWALAVLLCIAWSVAAIAGFPWLDRLDMAFFDTLARMDRHEPGKSHVVLVDVDESSLAAVGQWPWPRYRLAAMVKALASAWNSDIRIEKN
jgi:adenylate cyclase